MVEELITADRVMPELQAGRCWSRETMTRMRVAEAGKMFHTSFSSKQRESLLLIVLTNGKKKKKMM